MPDVGEVYVTVYAGVIGEDPLPEWSTDRNTTYYVIEGIGLYWIAVKTRP